jgi:hypothetical protein
MGPVTFIIGVGGRGRGGRGRILSAKQVGAKSLIGKLILTRRLVFLVDALSECEMSISRSRRLRRPSKAKPLVYLADDSHPQILITLPHIYLQVITNRKPHYSVE